MILMVINSRIFYTQEVIVLILFIYIEYLLPKTLSMINITCTSISFKVYKILRGAKWYADKR